MKFQCPNCNLGGSIDDHKVPENGITAACPKCGEHFLVKKEAPPDPSPDFTSPPVAPPDVPATAIPPKASQAAGGQTATRNDAPPSPPAGGSAKRTAPDPDADIRTFIGKNADKYVNKFACFKNGGRDTFAMTWHWPAFFVPFWWLIYRKQYWWAAFAFVISFIPFVGLLMMPIFGLTANYIYYCYTKKKIREIGGMQSEMSRAVEIARAGGVNNVAIVLVPLIGIAILGILAAIAIPQFAAYRAKSCNAAAMSELQKAKASVETYYAEHHAYPGNLAQANYVNAPEIQVRLDESTDSYTIIANHAKGDREFAVKSNSPGLLYRLSREPTSEFRPLQ